MLVTRRLKVALETSAQAWDAPTSCSFFLGADWRKVNQDFLSLHSPSDWMLIYKMQKHICQIFKDNFVIFLGFWGVFLHKDNMVVLLILLHSTCTAWLSQHFVCYKTVPLQYSVLQIWFSGCTERERGEAAVLCVSLYAQVMSKSR